MVLFLDNFASFFFSLFLRILWYFASSLLSTEHTSKLLFVLYVGTEARKMALLLSQSSPCKNSRYDVKRNIKSPA